MYTLYVKEVINILKKVNFRQKRSLKTKKFLPNSLDLQVSLRLSEKKLNDHFICVIFIESSHLRRCTCACRCKPKKLKGSFQYDRLIIFFSTVIRWPYWVKNIITLFYSETSLQFNSLASIMAINYHMKHYIMER